MVDKASSGVAATNPPAHAGKMAGTGAAPRLRFGKIFPKL
jgi:hypothetical protein